MPRFLRVPLPPRMRGDLICPGNVLLYSGFLRPPQPSFTGNEIGRTVRESMKRKDNRIPAFKTEDEERTFWATHSPLDYFDSSSIRKVVFPNLKPSLQSISIRIPSDMLAELKALANKMDVAYQSLAKVYLARQIAIERAAKSRPAGKKGDRKAPARRPPLTSGTKLAK